MAGEAIRVRPDGQNFLIELHIGDEVASSLEVIALVMRIGGSPVRMGGIGGVGTERKHRGKGYARRMLEYSTQWMAENGFDCATLFGIRDFYDKYGYAACLTDGRIEVATRDAERAQPSLTVRPYAPDDLPAVREIYAADSAFLTGSIVRDDNTAWFRKGSDYGSTPEVVVFVESAGEIVAYAARDVREGANVIRDEVVVGEVGARDPAHYADIARWAADRAIEMRVEKLVFLVPPESRCAAYLPCFGARQTLTFPRCAEGMGRLLRLESFLDKTLPEWTRRASETPALAAGASVRLETDIGAATLRWDGASVTRDDSAPASGTVRLPQWRLMQAAMGYYGADILAAFPEVQGEGDLRLFRALFPRCLPYMWRGDHF